MSELSKAKNLFRDAWLMEVKARQHLEKILPIGHEITFSKGGMRVNHNAEILCVSGERVKIFNLHTQKERWISYQDIRGI